MIHAKEPDFMRAPDNPTVLLIMGSVRAGRICPQIVEWVVRIGRACTNFRHEVVDLADWPLPMDDEPDLPHLGKYTRPHSLAWSKKIADADAVAFVTPQYNWGYPAPLKNAIDHLYREWRGKPVAIVSYGGHGGGKCAEQLKQVAVGLKMSVVDTSPGLTLPEDVIHRRRLLDPESDFAVHAGSVRQALTELAALVTLAA